MIAYRQPTDALTCATTFYGLEALKVGIRFSPKYEPFLKSHSKLLEDITVYQKKLADLFASMLFDYSVLACYGELRHMKDNCDVRYLGVGFTTAKCRNRNGAYENVVKYNPHDILKLCVHGFSPQNNWSENFGGSKWQMIAKHALKYGHIDNIEFCDTAFSLSHNCSPYLDKYETKIFCIYDRGTYKNFLDVKFEKTPSEIIEYIIMDSCMNSIDHEFKNLIHRAFTLGFIGSKYGYDFLFERIRAKKTVFLLDFINKRYAPIEFMNKKFNWRKAYNFCATAKESKFYDKIKAGQKAMILVDEKQMGHYYINTQYNPNESKNFIAFSELLYDKKITNSFDELEVYDKKGSMVLLRNIKNNMILHIYYHDIAIQVGKNKVLKIKE